jgi:phosphopantetheine adenylyltransferase
MIDEKLTDKIGPSVEEQMLSALERIESHLKALVFHSTPEKAFISSAGLARTPAAPKPADISEIIKQEVEKHLKENK